MSQQGNGHLFVGSVQPIGVSTGDIWVDTSGVPNVLKIWDGAAWSNNISAALSLSVGGISDTLEDFILTA